MSQAPGRQVHDTGAMGFFVYQADLGSNTLPANANATEPFSIGSVAKASYIVAFLSQSTCPGPSCNYIATANSGAIFAKVREPASLSLLGTGLVGLGLALGLRRRSRNLTSS